MRIFVAFALLLPTQDEGGESFTKFKVGTTWTLRQKTDDREKRITLSVLKSEGGKTTVQSKEYADEDEEPRIDTALWYVEDGYLIWEMGEGDAKLTVRVLKLGSKKGESWKGTLRGKEEYEGTNLGTEELTVPAGTYKNVIHVRLSDPKGAGTFHFAPGVGLIKLEQERGRQRVVTELTEFKPAK
jgi:hypothetical protein